MNRSEIYKKVFETLSQKREHAQLVAEINKNKAEKNKAYSDLLLKQRMLTMEIGKIKFEGHSASKQEKELEKIIKQKEEMLNSMGLTSEDLLPKYDCPKCADTGIYQNGYCQCVMQMYNNILMQDCGVDLSAIPNLKNYDCKFFTTEKEIEFAKKSVATLGEYVSNLDKTKFKNIVMCGGSGTGKTYLTKCIAKELLSK